jgi:hypothetical protein
MSCSSSSVQRGELQMGPQVQIKKKKKLLGYTRPMHMRLTYVHIRAIMHWHVVVPGWKTMSISRAGRGTVLLASICFHCIFLLYPDVDTHQCSAVQCSAWTCICMPPRQREREMMGVHVDIEAPPASDGNLKWMRKLACYVFP